MREKRERLLVRKWILLQINNVTHFSQIQLIFFSEKLQSQILIEIEIVKTVVFYFEF